jgi:large subunit ribosomal protein L1
MAKKGKNYRAAKLNVDVTKVYDLAEAVALVRSTSYVSFDASMEIAIKTNANPKYNDQAIRATVSLPNGTGKSPRVAAFVYDDKIDEAKKAGADIAGNQSLLDDIKAGKMDFDVLVTSPDMMRDLAAIAKQL